VFPIGEQRYALPAETVEEVVAQAAVTPIPGTPPTIAGVLMHRGQAITVIALDSLLGLKTAPAAGAPSVAVTITSRGAIGLQITGDTAFREVAADPRPNTAEQGEDGCVVACSDGLARLLDADAIAANPAAQVATWPAGHTIRGGRH
jgi:chemotaxis signal transduction protein